MSAGKLLECFLFFCLFLLFQFSFEEEPFVIAVSQLLLAKCYLYNSFICLLSSIVMVPGARVLHPDISQFTFVILLYIFMCIQFDCSFDTKLCWGLIQQQPAVSWEEMK